MVKEYGFISMYSWQLFHDKHINRYNVHGTIGSTRKKGGYNYDMNLLEVYKEILPQLEAAGLVVTKKYFRLKEGLTFSSLSDAKRALRKLISAIKKVNKN